MSEFYQFLEKNRIAYERHDHPLVNTSTLVISRDNLKRFIAKTGHEAKILNVPGME
jgi:hypothetical protein